LDEMSVEVEAMVYPTEDCGKVLGSINNMATLQEITEMEIRPGIHIIRGKGYEKECLTKLRDLIRQDRIRDAARALLCSTITTNGLQFYLNKQVAFANHVSFCNIEGESPLGPISVKIKCSNPATMIDWLASGFQDRADSQLLL